ncbi:ABC transporter permease subunit [Nocardioides zeae]|uniref:Peptide/nickel transport system permease protein n=1 Tax=Nocardioides zeae TaxID=1457234 RepID=A0AAJ1TX47_9ACTN|nr:ABC transporter permease subunit [Nocardioides zeae]MDQ1103906.1 peptide/nickel transport system permease protein [Nocardioides zeae]
MSAVLRVLATVAGLVLVVASLPWLRGEDPAVTVLRVRFRQRGEDPDAVRALREQLDLAPDPVTGAARWLAAAARGDLGESWVSGQPVLERAQPAVAASATLAGCAIAVALVLTTLALIGPVVRAARTGTATRPRLKVAAVTVAALPEVITGSLLVVALSVHLGLLPATGWHGWGSVVAPALALGVPAAGLLTRLLAGVLDQAVTEQWVTTWRANGVPTAPVARALARRVVGRGASQVAVVWVGMLGTAVAVEKVFSVPGVGSLAVRSALTQDVPVLQACLLAVVGLGLAGAGAALLLHRLLLVGATGRDDLGVTADASHGSPRVVVLVTVVLAVLVLGGLPRDGGSSDLAARLAPPGVRHPLGADAVGHDLWGRVADATVRTVGLAVLVSVLALAVALLVGLAARRLRVGAMDVLVTVPSTVVGMVVAAALGPGLLGACVAVAAVAWIPLAVHARGLVVEARGAGHVGAARRLGLGRARVGVVHLLPGVLGPLAQHALARLPLNAVAIAGLSFIGLGADPDAAELGAMLAEGLRYLEVAPWVVLVPGGVLLLLGVGAGAAGGVQRRARRTTRLRRGAAASVGG